MLKRSSPRSRSARVMANGNTVAIWPLTLPVLSSSSSSSTAPAVSTRDTVPATSGCAELPFGKIALCSYGSYRGASCISCRHAARNGRSETTEVRSNFLLMVNLHHLTRMQAREELLRRVGIELRVGRLDGEEESALARALEPRHVEDRVIRLRQP